MIEKIITAILNSIGNLLNVVWGALCIPIYFLISLFYDVFTAIPRVNILSDIGIEDIYQRITMIIVIVMAFYISFEVVKYVVQPDIITDKQKGSGSLIKKIVIVILLLAFVPRIFTMAYDLQGRILKGDFISIIILGKNENKEGALSTLGSNFSANLFGLFYTINPESCPSDGNETKLGDAICNDAQKQIDTTLDFLRGGKTMGAVGMALATITSVITNFIPTLFGDTPINFSGLLALGVGIYVLWTLIVYSVEVGKRYFQLIYLQIIAPIAIMSYLTPKKDGMLSKWTKQCVTTYLDLFIRIAIINFVMLLSGILHENFFGSNSIINSIGQDAQQITWKPDVLLMVYLFLIIGLLAFAKKAPKLLSELFPSSGAAAGNMGLWEPTKSLVGGIGRTIGGAVGTYTGINSAVQSIKSGSLKGQDRKSQIWSAAKAGFAGAKTGFSKGGSIKKANAAARSSLQKDEDIVLKGGNVIGHDFKGGYYQEVAKQQDRRLEDYKQAKTGMDLMASQLDEFKQVKTIKKSWDAAKAAGDAVASRRFEAQYKSLSQALRGALVKHDGKIEIDPSTGKVVNSVTGEEIVVTYKYSDIDERGVAIPGTERVETYQYDSGDSEFAEAFTHVAKEERRKTKGSALDELKVTIKRQKTNPTTGQPEIKPDGTPDMEDVTVRVAELSTEEYAQYIHKIKDAASIAETKDKDKDYSAAHANANENSGK